MMLPESKESHGFNRGSMSKGTINERIDIASDKSKFVEVYIIMRVMISIILMVIAALVGFFFGAGMSEAMGGAILLSMITGFACTISAIEKNKKE